MSQIASFYLLKDGQRQELSNGDCSGAVYMAIWDWCESELDLDVRFPAPQSRVFSVWGAGAEPPGAGRRNCRRLGAAHRGGAKRT